MGDSLFDIFGDRLNQNLRNARQPLSNAENLGKMAVKSMQGPIKQQQGPIKPIEMLKKAENKKSFLSNKGMAIQGTPVRTPFTPRKVNVGSLIYTDDSVKTEAFDFNEIEFTEPKYLFDNYHKDVIDCSPLEECQFVSSSPIGSPTPKTLKHEMDYSIDEDYEWDMSSNPDLVVDDLGLPDIF